MADYKVIYTDLLTGTIHGELPVIDLDYSFVLNSPGSFTANLPLLYEGLRAAVDVDGTIIEPTQLYTEETLAPGRTAIWIYRDDVLLWGGILWTARADVAGNVLEIAGEGFLSLLRKRILKKTMTFVEEDQTLIAMMLIDYAMSPESGASVWDVYIIDAQDTLSTDVYRDRTYYYYEYKNIGEAIEQLAAVEDGFDFSFKPAWSDFSGRHYASFRIQYPTSGRLTDHIFELGTNVEVLDLSIDGTTIVNRVQGVGAGEGDTMVRASSTNAAMLASYPLLEDIITFKDISQSSTLRGHTNHELTRGSNPMKIPTLRASGQTIPTLGSYEVGDRVKVRGTYGYFSLDDYYRVTEIKVAVDQNGKEDIDLSLALADVFTT